MEMGGELLKLEADTSIHMPKNNKIEATIARTDWRNNHMTSKGSLVSVGVEQVAVRWKWEKYRKGSVFL